MGHAADSRYLDEVRHLALAQGEQNLRLADKLVYLGDFVSDFRLFRAIQFFSAPPNPAEARRTSVLVKVHQIHRAFCRVLQQRVDGEEPLRRKPHHADVDVRASVRAACDVRAEYVALGAAFAREQGLKPTDLLFVRTDFPCERIPF